MTKQEFEVYNYLSFRENMMWLALRRLKDLDFKKPLIGKDDVTH